MEKIAMICLWCLILTGSAYATEQECPNGFTLTTSQQGHQHCYLDTDTDTDTNTDTVNEAQDEAGVGADIVLWKNEKEDALVEEFTVEYRRDLANDTNEIYGVVRINLWAKIKNIFNKGDQDDTNTSN